MGIRGAFGFIINDKKYLMYVFDAYMLWDNLIKEIYILL